MTVLTHHLLPAVLLLSAAGPVLAQWRYANEVDKMTGKASPLAIVRSDDSLDLPFPYKGPNYGRLQVRNLPGTGLETLFFVDKGQMICPGYENCYVMVKFDDKPPMKFSTVKASDHDPKVTFLRDAKKFVAQAKNAKTILVQATFFHAGTQVLTFKTPTSLEWK